MTVQRVTSRYDPMASAYDAPQIHAFSRSLGPVPSIDPHPRGGNKLPLAPAAAARFKECSAAARVNSLLKERYGGRWVRVRGAAKVMCQLMFGLVALPASALFARLCCRPSSPPPVVGGPETRAEIRRARWRVGQRDQKRVGGV